MFDYAIIPDWRFINEFETVANEIEDYCSIVTIRIKRFDPLTKLPYINPNMTNEQLNHISECELDNFPFEWIIENRGSLAKLEESIKELLNIWHL